MQLVLEIHWRRQHMELYLIESSSKSMKLKRPLRCHILEFWTALASVSFTIMNNFFYAFILTERNFFVYVHLESFRHNSFEQFCINYGSENLHSFFMDRMLQSEYKLYCNEGLSLPKIHIPTNEETLGISAILFNSFSIRLNFFYF